LPRVGSRGLGDRRPRAGTGQRPDQHLAAGRRRPRPGRDPAADPQQRQPRPRRDRRRRGRRRL